MITILLKPENDGKMVSGARTGNGKEYYFYLSEAVTTGWVKRETDMYYYFVRGALLKNAW